MRLKSNMAEFSPSVEYHSDRFDVILSHLNQQVGIYRPNIAHIRHDHVLERRRQKFERDSSKRAIHR
jgi:hypothetical protein